MADPLDPVRIDSVMAAIGTFDRLLGPGPDERLIVVHLDGQGMVIGQQLFGGGESTRISLPVRDIVGRALALGAAAIVLGHNHPSGDPTPSRADLDGTRLLANTLRPLGVRVRDHLILGGESWTSLRDLGLL